MRFAIMTKGFDAAAVNVGNVLTLPKILEVMGFVFFFLHASREMC
jgi:hypothetical protein